MEAITEIKNANDALSEYIGTEEWYKYSGGILLTEGTKALAEMFKCYWFLDIIVSYQSQIKERGLQVWKLTRAGNKATITCEDGNYKILKAKEIEFTDFAPETATVWVEGNVILLPSEH